MRRLLSVGVGFFVLAALLIIAAASASKEQFLAIATIAPLFEAVIYVLVFGGVILALVAFAPTALKEAWPPRQSVPMDHSGTTIPDNLLYNPLNPRA